MFLGLMILRELASLFYCFAFNASSIIAFSSGLLGAGAAKDSTRPSRSMSINRGMPVT